MEWNTGDVSKQGDVRVSRNGGEERPLATGAEGRVALKPVIVGSAYRVRLYVEDQLEPIAEEIVTRNLWPRPREDQPAELALDLGELRRTTPISARYGYERGQPVDRYYTEDFLTRRSEHIRGDVLEVQDGSYATHYGGDRVSSIDILDVTSANPRATIIADLNEPRSLPSNSFDCVILTQTLPVIREPAIAIRSVHEALREAGVLLATFPGISQLTKDPTNFHWRLTPSSAKEMLSRCFAPEEIEVTAPGNVLTAAAFLYGIAADELELSELEADDPRYDVVICVTARKGRPLTSPGE